MLQKSLLASSLAGSACALTMRQPGCAFHVRAEGAASVAPVGQYPSGQCRAGPHDAPASFTLRDGTLTDGQGRGCWWTPPALVWQCDVGQVPQAGFGIGCDGAVSYHGQTTFYQCETGADGLVMLYLGPNGSNCSEVALRADGCYPGTCNGGGGGATAPGRTTSPGSGGGSTSPGQYPGYTPSGSNPSSGGSSATPTSTSPGSTSSGGRPPGGGGGSTPPEQYPGSPPGGSTPGSSPPGGGGAGSTPPGYPSGTPPGGGGSGQGSTPPGYPVGTPTGGAPPSNTSPGGGNEGPTPPGYPSGAPPGNTPPGGGGGGSTPPGYPVSTPTGGTPLGTTPGNTYPGGTPPGNTSPGSTPTGGQGSTPPGGYPGYTPSSTPSNGGGSPPPGGYPVGTPSRSTPTGGYPTGPGGPPGKTGTPTGGYPTGPGGPPGGGGTPGVSCPGELGANYEYPHLIIPVDSSKANSAPGTSLFGTVSASVSSAFNFDIPASAAGKTCNAVFYFPQQRQLETSSYTFSGSGAVDFARLSGPVTTGTSYANLPGAAKSSAQTIAPGNAYHIESFPCPAGQSVAYKISAAKGDGSTSFRYFQDYNPCPIGLYITVS